MTRNRKVDIDQLEREYIYDQGNPPVSFTDLAERHGVARNTVALRATAGKWYERRKAFRETLGVKVVEAMGDEYVKLEAAFRERVISTGLMYLAQYEKKLADGEVTISTRDMLGVAAMLRTLTQDAVTKATDGELKLIDPGAEKHLEPDEYRQALAALDQFEAGTGDEPDDDPGPEASGASGARPN